TPSRPPRSRDSSMSFGDVLAKLALRELSVYSNDATDQDVDHALAKPKKDLRDFAALLSPVAGKRLEELARASHAVTLRRFGHTVHMYAPIYLSNECLTTCTYCGFAKDLPIARKTLGIEQAVHERSEERR